MSDLNGRTMVPLEITYPKPAFLCTPRPLPKNTDAIWPPGPAFMLVPHGARNLAFGKRVLSSDPEPIIGDLLQVTDGDKYPYEGSWVELACGRQWVQIDLGKASEIWGIVVWHYHAEPRVYRDVVVQLSENDENFLRGVTTVFNNDRDNSSGLGAGQHREYFESHFGKIIETAGRKARYVRLYSRGNTSDDQNHYSEVEVYGLD